MEIYGKIEWENQNWDQRRHGRTFGGELPQKDNLSARLVRLPMWAGLESTSQDEIIEAVYSFYRNGK